jgi:sec-independent protein translocase protein TatA
MLDVLSSRSAEALAISRNYFQVASLRNQGDVDMFGLGPLELGIILAIVVVLFGAKRLPELGSGIGKAIKNFKSGMSGNDEIDVTPEKESVEEGESKP